MLMFCILNFLFIISRGPFSSFLLWGCWILETRIFLTLCCVRVILYDHVHVELIHHLDLIVLEVLVALLRVWTSLPIIIVRRSIRLALTVSRVPNLMEISTVSFRRLLASSLLRKRHKLIQNWKFVIASKENHPILSSYWLLLWLKCVSLHLNSVAIRERIVKNWPHRNRRVSRCQCRKSAPWNLVLGG